MQSIRLSGGEVFYRQQGQGPPLLLLHGWGGSSSYWHGTLNYLADQRTVYAPDLPGYGVSPPWSGKPSIERAAACVSEFADALGLDHVDLNGHSFSSSVAVWLAASAPQRVRRLVLTCASTYRNTFERRMVRLAHSVLGLWIGLRRYWMTRVPFIYRSVAKRFFYRVPDDDGLLRANFEEFLRMDGRTALSHAADVANIDYHAALRRVAAPTLVIGARQDQVMPQAGTPYVAKLIPDSQLVWIEQCGHLPMIEQPEEYHRLLRDFLLTEP
jgi:pimeloyl-ACP methyl ester carboxylesterase